MVFQDSRLLPWRGCSTTSSSGCAAGTPRERGRAGARRGRPGRPREGLAARAVRRRAAAGRPGPLAGPRARAAAGRRAVRRARRADPDPDAHPAARAVRAAPAVGPAGHPRRRRGDRAGRPGRRAGRAAGSPSTDGSTCRRPRPRRAATSALLRRELLAALGVDAASPRADCASTAPEGTEIPRRQGHRMTQPRKLHLNAFLMSVGHHEAVWRLPGERPVRQHQTSSTTRSSPASPSAASSTRCSSPTARCCGATSAAGPSGTLEPTVLLTALARRHRAHRPDRDRVDDLQRAVQPGPALRLARPRQRRPRRLEHRHHRRRRRGPQLRPRRPARRTPTATSGPPSSSRSPPSCGTAGRTTRRSATRRAASGATRQRIRTHRPRRQALPGRAAR